MRPLISAAICAAILARPAASQSSAPAAHDTAAFSYLAGEWRVVSHRRGIGRAEPASGESLRFAPAPAGPGLVSHWRMNRGSVAQPQMVDALYVLGYDRASARWSFYFLSDRSAQFYEGRLEGGVWFFHREYVSATGERLLQRQSWRRVSDDEVRRSIEDSADAGATWTFVYEGELRRVR